MEAVGQLTGGIAHDFNNMLAVVVGGLELARRKLHQDPAHADRPIANAMEGANRASALPRRLLAFARSQPLLPESLDHATLVQIGIQSCRDSVCLYIKVSVVATSYKKK